MLSEALASGLQQAQSVLLEQGWPVDVVTLEYDEVGRQLVGRLCVVVELPSLPVEVQSEPLSMDIDVGVSPEV